jgi:hypothetical protein
MNIPPIHLTPLRPLAAGIIYPATQSASDRDAWKGFAAGQGVDGAGRACRRPRAATLGAQRSHVALKLLGRQTGSAHSREGHRKGPRPVSLRLRIAADSCTLARLAVTMEPWP